MSATLTAEERTLRAQLAAHSLHSTIDSEVHTQKARAAFLARFEFEVDPSRSLPEAERQRRAHQALRAHMSRLALRKAQMARVRREVEEEEALCALLD